MSSTLLDTSWHQASLIYPVYLPSVSRGEKTEVIQQLLYTLSTNRIIILGGTKAFVQIVRNRLGSRGV